VTHTEQLSRRVYLWTAAFSFGGCLLLAWTVPFLLLLGDTTRGGASIALLLLLATGGVLALSVGWFRLRKHRFLLQALAVDNFSGKRAYGTRDKPTNLIDVGSMVAFINEPGALTRAWLLSECSMLLVLLTPLRPATLDLTTAVTVALLAALVLATASLPMLVLVRRDFLAVIERAPLAAMQELVSRTERTRTGHGRINRRIIAAVTMPVVFVALGCALIVNAHLRRDDERSRAETARMLARAALEMSPGNVGGLERAIARATELGFPAQIASPDARYGVIVESDGIAELTTPLDSGSARVRFSSSTVGVLGLAPVVVSLLAAVGAAVLGFLLGNLLSTDLYFATRGVRMLGTNPGLGATGAGVIQRARLRVVAELFEAIERLADRFAVFAQAQEDAISARATATRTRGLFFASVSHDLKSPLNSILGFTQLVSLEPLTKGQVESLHAIHSRARELLALIETILDAARVEEGQLSLAGEEVQFSTLFTGAVQKASELSADYPVQIFEEFESQLPPLLIDRVRVQRAVATLIAYSVRTNRGGKMWIRAEREAHDRLRVDIDVPSPEHSPRELEAMLSTHSDQERREHRGLALGLRLARSVVKLHGGAVRVVDRGKKGAMFCVSLPTASVPLPSRSAPSHSIPPPPTAPSGSAQGGTQGT
jgi:signal transduction histidine kinase